MYPKSAKHALARQLSVERAFEKLADRAFGEWLPHARKAVLGNTLTAAVDPNELPPDIAGLMFSSAFWESAMDGSLTYGAELMHAYEYFETLAAIDGVTVEQLLTSLAQSAQASGTVLPIAADAALAAFTRQTVATAFGVQVEAIVELDRKLSALPTIRESQSSYLAGVRNRMVNTPEATFRDISRVIDLAIAAGDSPNVMRKAVEEHLSPATGNWKNRAVTIARTESAGAMSSATIRAAIDRNEVLDEVLEQVWIATLDGKTRKTHWAADGQRVPLGGKFTLGVNEVAFPGDPDAAVGETANCRCRVAVLSTTEKLPHEKDRHTERGPGDSTVVHRSGSQSDEIERREAEGNIRARDDPDGIGRVASITAPTKEETMTAAVTLADKVEETDELDKEDAQTVEKDKADEEKKKADETDGEDDDDEKEIDGELFRTFTDSVIAVFGTPTDDRRILASDMDIRFREFPLPLMWTKTMTAGHYDAYTVGVIESSRREGDALLASGYLLNTPEADTAAEQIAHGVTGPSVDLGDADVKYTTETGEEVTEEMWMDAMDNEEELKIFDTVTSARLMGATLVSTPAFGEVSISLDAERSTRGSSLVAAALDSLTASGYVEKAHPAAFFSDPQFTGPTPIRLTAEGRLEGHLACFGTCHVGFADRCVTAPRSLTDYAHFHTAPPVLTETGERIAVGRLTVATGHAGRGTANQAAEHYDNTGTCFGLVRMGEDEHGIWFSGVPAPGVTNETMAVALSAPLSGDWRKKGGNLELVAALAVNTPGFPVVSQITDDDNENVALVASLAPRVPKAAKASKDLDPVALAMSIVSEMRAADRRAVEAASLIETRSTRNYTAALSLIERVK